MRPFMKTRLLSIALAFFPLGAIAQNIDPDVDFSRIEKSDFVEEMRVMNAVMWPSMMQLYVRLDPSLEELVPEFEWSEAHTEGTACVYDRLSEQGKLSQVNAMRDQAIAFLDVVETRTDITFASLATDDELIALLSPQDSFADATSDCGLAELNIQTMKESGLMDAITKLMMSDPAFGE